MRGRLDVSYLFFLTYFKKKANMKYTHKRHIYGGKENTFKLLRVILKSDVCEDIGIITLYYQKSLSVWLFPCKLLQCFPLTLTLKKIRSRASTSSAEQDYIVTTYDSCKDCILACKIGNQIHAMKFKERKVRQYSFAQKIFVL